MSIRSKKPYASVALYAVLLLYITLAPFEFDLGRQPNLTKLLHIDLLDIAVNILLFMPLGLLIANSLHRPSKYRMAAIAFFVGLTLSIGIEVCQLFLPRAPSFIDLFTNASGSMLGAVLFYFYGEPFSKALYSINSIKTASIILFLVGYSAAVTYWHVLPASEPVSISNWKMYYPFVLGNEATLDRPWQGEIYELAIYGDGLTAAEVRELYDLEKGSASNLIPSHLVSKRIRHFNFLENRGHWTRDGVNSDIPFKLRLMDQNAIRWLPGGGLALDGESAVKAKGGSKLFPLGFNFHNSAFAVELWFKGTKEPQFGPARIVSYSLNTQLRNFSISQKDRHLNIRLRTPLTGKNGTEPEFDIGDAEVNGSEQHLVLSVVDEKILLFMDGNLIYEQSLRIPKTRYEVWEDLEDMGRYRVAFLDFLILPVLLSFYILCTSKNRKRVTTAVGLSLLLLIAFVLARKLYLDRVIDLSLSFRSIVVLVFSTAVFCYANKE